MNKRIAQTITCPLCNATSVLNRFGDPTDREWYELHPNNWYAHQESYLCRRSYTGVVRLIHADPADLAKITFKKSAAITRHDPAPAPDAPPVPDAPRYLRIDAIVECLTLDPQAELDLVTATFKARLPIDADVDRIWDRLGDDTRRDIVDVWSRYRAWLDDDGGAHCPPSMSQPLIAARTGLPVSRLLANRCVRRHHACNGVARESWGNQLHACGCDCHADRDFDPTPVASTYVDWLGRRVFDADLGRVRDSLDALADGIRQARIADILGLGDGDNDPNAVLGAPAFVKGDPADGAVHLGGYVSAVAVKCARCGAPGPAGSYVFPDRAGATICGFCLDHDDLLRLDAAADQYAECDYRIERARETVGRIWGALNDAHAANLDWHGLRAQINRAIVAVNDLDELLADWLLNTRDQDANDALGFIHEQVDQAIKTVDQARLIAKAGGVASVGTGTYDALSRAAGLLLDVRADVPSVFPPSPDDPDSTARAVESRLDRLALEYGEPSWPPDPDAARARALDAARELGAGLGELIALQRTQAPCGDWYDADAQAVAIKYGHVPCLACRPPLPDPVPVSEVIAAIQAVRSEYEIKDGTIAYDTYRILGKLAGRLIEATRSTADVGS